MDRASFKWSFSKQKRARMKAKAAAATPESTAAPRRANSREQSNGADSDYFGPVKDEFIKQPFKNADNALRDSLNLLAQEDWYPFIPFLIPNRLVNKYP